jgi:hypothetical protein
VSSDPLRVVWDALAARECRPHGKQHDFRARCPGHDGTNRGSLHVAVGADGRAIVHCFAHGCSAEEICAGLGLSVADLFPDGHHRSRRAPAMAVRRSDFTGSAKGAADALYALSKIGANWDLMLSSDCPYCTAQGAWLRADSTGRLYIDCPEGCTTDQYTGALLGRAQEQTKQVTTDGVSRWTRSY